MKPNQNSKRRSLIPSNNFRSNRSWSFYGDPNPSPSSGSNYDSNDLFDRLRGKPFWDWDEGENHKTKYDKQGNPNCCFNCIVGWPEKNGKKHPMYDYEKMVYDALMARAKPGEDDSTDKHVWIKKATGLGITEFVLRFAVWLATRNNELKGSHVCIVTGPNYELAKDLIDRVRQLFVEFPDVTFEIDSSYKILINGVTFQAYPSNHLESARGIPHVSIFFLDEAGFFGIHEQEKENPTTVSERYIGKSNPYLIMCSTPNLPDDIFGSIEFKENPIYKKLFLPYNVGLGKIYSTEDIERAKQTPSWRREFCLEYLGAFGDLFKPESIAIAEKQGLACQAVVKNEIRQDTYKTMGVDAGYGSSAFGIVVTQLNDDDGKIEVLYADDFERPDFNDMIEHILYLKENYKVEKIFVDGSNVPVITALKKAMGERVDYLPELQKIKHKHPPDPARWMDVIPVYFNQEGKQMLIATYMMLDLNWLSIHPKFTKLLSSMRTARAREGLLDKGATAHDDVLDAFRLALKPYKLPESS